MPNLYNKWFRKNKLKREKEEEALKKSNTVKQQAEQKQRDAATHRNEHLAKIATACRTTRDRIFLWHQTEFSRINDSYNQKQTEYTETINDLHRSREHYLQKIADGFNLCQEKLRVNRQADEQRLKTCCQTVNDLANKTQDRYGNNKFALNRLWKQVEDQMLHQHCITAYEQLKQSVNPDISRTKNYSLLVGYVRQLFKQNLIDDLEFERYTQFVAALCSMHNIEHNEDFKIIDHEIIDLLQLVHNRDRQIIANAYRNDQKQQKKIYAQALEFDNALSLKVAAVKNDIDAKYEQALLDLINERNQKNHDLQNTCKDTIQQIVNEQEDYKNTYNTYVTDLNHSKNTQINEIDVYEEQEKQAVNNQYQTYIDTINQELQQKLQSINNVLEAQLKQLKHSVRATIVNALTTVTAATAAYLSGGLLAGAGGYLAESVQASLLLTSLRSLERLANGKDKFGADFRINLADHPPGDHFNVSRGSNDLDFAATEALFKESSVNLTALHNKFREFIQSVQSWQETAEQNLFYSLNLEISPVHSNFFDALTLYSAQGSSNTLFNGQVRLDQLQANGLRSVEWGITLNNQAKWYGTNIMRNTDLNNIIQRSSNTSMNTSILNDIFNMNRDLDQPQIFNFSGTTNANFSTDNINTKKISWAEKTLDFFMPAAYADELPLPNIEDSFRETSFNTAKPEGTFSVFLKAVGGDGGAKLEIRNRSATWAKFFDTANVAHEECLVGAGRSTVKTGQTLKKIWYGIAEDVGIKKQWTTKAYIQQIDTEKKLYGNTSVGQSTFGRGTEVATDLFFAYAGGRMVFTTLGTVGSTIYSKYTTERTLRNAINGGKYSGELREYRNQEVKGLRKTISSHQKTIAEHKEYMKNPKLKYQEKWDRMSKDLKDKAIHHWKEDIKRAKIYEELAKRVLKEETSSIGSNKFPKTPKP